MIAAFLAATGFVRVGTLVGVALLDRPFQPIRSLEPELAGSRNLLAIELFRESGRAAGLFVSARRRRNSRGFQIDLRLRQLAEQGIGLPLFLKRLVEERRGIFHAELRRPSLQRAVARHFVVLDGLAASE